VLIHRVSTAGIGVLCQLECEGPFRAEVLQWMPGYVDSGGLDDGLEDPLPADLDEDLDEDLDVELDLDEDGRVTSETAGS
jgi:hypothetical protein